MKNILFTCLLLSVALLLSCGGDDSEPAIIASFSLSESEGEENVSVVTAQINLSASSASNLELLYELNGSATLNGDYTISSSSPLIIPAGSTSAAIELEIINDDVIESVAIQNGELIEAPRKNIIITLSPGNGNVSVDNKANTFTYSIIDDDGIPETGMKCDLFWSVQGTNNSDRVNLDIFPVYDVVIEGGVVTDLVPYETQDGFNVSGFESFIIEEDAPDSDYYIIIQYTEGTGDADWKFFSYLTETITFGEDTFLEADQDFVLILGPIATKTGESFARILNRKSQISFQKVRVEKGLLN